MTALRRGAFFDRDGVVNVSPGSGYVLTLEAFQLCEGIVDVLRWCKDAGFVTVLVTSQQGVGKGLMSEADLGVIHDGMQTRLEAFGAAFDGIYACTHLAGSCECRKPSPVMIRRAAAELGLDLARSFIVGDHDRDIQMGINAGLPMTVRVLGEEPVGVEATVSVASLAELVGRLQDWVG